MFYIGILTVGWSPTIAEIQVVTLKPGAMWWKMEAVNGKIVTRAPAPKQQQKQH